jgi:site-specific recombinase XerD
MGRFRDRFKRDLQIRGYADNTVDQYVHCVRNLVKHYMRPPDELTVDDINNFQLHLTKERKVAWSTFNIYVFAMRVFFLETLKKDWEVTAIPYQKTGRKLPEILSGSELNALFKSLSNIKHRAILMTTYSAGLRLSEVINLQVSDVDSQRMVIRVEQGKGRKDRCVPLSDRLLPVLRQYWKAARPPGWLFQGQDPNRPLNPSSVQLVFKKAKKRAGITKNVTVHSLRHSFATHMLERGVDIRTIQRLLGHRSLSSTQVYTHVAKNYVNQAGSPLDTLDGIEELLPLPRS